MVTVIADVITVVVPKQNTMPHVKKTQAASVEIMMIISHPLTIPFATSFEFAMCVPLC